MTYLSNKSMNDMKIKFDLIKSIVYSLNNLIKTFYYL